ncbi:hypothetical protein, conserved [Leishmania tarentolae]|uniref:Uncharacterized protein n=1 Tax=Leishmania tarentolae TaxID=5689 RepID=A0A640KQA1_LEITA|nr:hypothetical protein, conserved [Leishmania tarentolae]
MPQGANQTAGAVRANAVPKAFSPSLSDSSDEHSLRMHLVTGGTSRYVGPVSDDDYETSSEETETSDFLSDNSEDYVPLAFEYISSNPTRRAGAPAYSKLPSGVLEEEEEDKDDSLSFSDAPLEVFLERSRTRRHCGPGAKDSNRAEVMSSVSSHYKDDDDSSSTNCAVLPIAFERRKKTHNVGKVKQTTYEASDGEFSVSLPDEEESPLNAQLIHTLIKRLRNPADEVSLEAFDFVDFSDENFKEELEPLKQIKALLEERVSNPIMTSEKHNHAVKEAVQFLPPENAIAAKVKAIKSRHISQSKPKMCVYRGGEAEVAQAEAIEDLVRRLKDPDTKVPLHAFEEVDWSNQDFNEVLAVLGPIRAYMKAKEVAKEKPEESTIHGAPVLDDKIKEAIMSLPSEEAMAATIHAVKNRAMSSSSSNGDAIRHLVAFLKESGQTVKPSEFAKLDWDDRNFSRELEPLQEIRACMEAKEALQEKPVENVMANQLAFDEQIKVAIMSLPPEKAIAVKTQILKMHERASATSQRSQRARVAKLSAAAGTKKKLKDSLLMSSTRNKSKPKEGNLSASSSQVIQVGAKVILTQQPKYTAKESTALSAPAKKVRRAKVRCDRSISISKVDDDLPPGEIIEDDQELPESGVSPLSEADTTPQHLSRIPSRPPGMRKSERRPRKHRQTNNSFASIPTEEPGVIEEEQDKLVGTMRKAGRRRARQKLCRSLSITSLPNLEAGEMLEEPSPFNTGDASSAHPARAREAKPRRLRPKLLGNTTQLDQPLSEVAGDVGDDNTALQGKAHSVAKKKRRRMVTNSKSCIFLEVFVDEASAIQDEGAGELKGVGPQHETIPSKRTKNLVRRRRHGDEDNDRSLDNRKPEVGEAREIHDAQHSNMRTAKKRRGNVHRTRSACTSMVAELMSGEIVERPDETRILYTSSGASTPVPEEASAKHVNRQDIPAKTENTGMTRDLSTMRKRRTRLHMSKELSISAIPENRVGEIVENAPDSLAATAPVGGIFSNAGQSKAHIKSARHLPLLKSTERGYLRYADRSNSSLGMSAKSRGEIIMPNVDASFIRGTMSNSPTPSSSAFRRSAEEASHVSITTAKGT